MRLLRRFRFVAVALLTGTFSIAPTVNLGTAQLATPTAVVIADGRVVPATPGLIIKVGTTITGPDGSQLCTGLDAQVRIALPEGWKSASVVLNSTDCILRVEDVQFVRGGVITRSTPFDRFGFAASAATEHRIWARQHMDEYIGIWTTWVYQEFTYLEDTTLNAVWNPQQYQGYCAHDGVGWNFSNCYVGTVSSGDAHVERYTHGDFTNNCCGGIQHSLQANPWAEVGISYQACYFAGTWPAGWHGPVCEGGRAY